MKYETSIDGESKHGHEVSLDENGNGKLTKVIGQVPDHSHEVTQYKVDPAGDDGHTHSLKKVESRASKVLKKLKV